MAKSVEQFIEEVHKAYNVKYALTAERKRSLKFKLAMADIAGSVSDADAKIATDIILGDYGKASSNMRTASMNASTLRNAGTCPRCSQAMTYTKLADSREARYCSNCHVCIGE